jgi:mannose-1-phosphate guanylyltransferase
MANAYAVVMAGGAGTRFWPASRARTPKQLLALAGDKGEPLLAATVRRLSPLIPPQRVYIATGAQLLDATRAILPAVPAAQILAEPAPRNTAPCVGWATSTILRRDPDATVAVLPSDHFIQDEKGFLEAVGTALEVAQDDSLVTIGVVPTRPETGYGYIEVGARLHETGPAAFRAARFVEKPDKARAEAFFAGGKHLWNAGMFFYRARAMASAVREHLPELAAGLDRIDRAAAEGSEREAAELAATFPGLPSISIDHGVMEKASRVAVVPGNFGWNDVGSWESAWELSPKDAVGNALPPDAVAIDAKGNLAVDRRTEGKKRVYALVGVQDLVLVETDDAVLVIPRDRAQDVRLVVEELRRRKDTSRL